MDFLFRLIEPAQSFLFEQAVLPAIYHLGYMAYAEDAYEATGFMLLGLLQVALIYALLRPLEAWHPVEPWPDRRGVRSDVVYTILERSGLLPLLFFVLLQPLLTPLEQGMRSAGYLPPNLEEWIPGLAAHPFLAFAVYILLLDFFEYWRHRLQHRFSWWWALHATHHSQRVMSFWTDDRNHVVDSLIEALWLTALGYLIGIPSELFAFAILFMRLVENLSHANVRLHFGAIGNRVLVSPLFHRIHHGIGVGHEGKVHGCNFATLFPIWDILFGTANFSREWVPTGIRDQLSGADYGDGFLSQQANGLQRLWQALRPAKTGVNA